MLYWCVPIGAVSQLYQSMSQVSLGVLGVLGFVDYVVLSILAIQNLRPSWLNNGLHGQGRAHTPSTLTGTLEGKHMP